MAKKSIKTYKPIIKAGTHLASSKETDGAVRGALLDDVTNKVVGQAEWEEVLEESAFPSSAIGAAVLGAAALGVAATVGVMSAAKAIKENSDEIQEMNEKERIKAEILKEEYRQKELRKSEKRMARERVREEKREIRNAAIKKYLKLGVIYFFKGIWIIIKYTGIALAWCAKKTFIGIKAFSLWICKKIKQSIEKRKASKLSSEMAVEQLHANTYTELSTKLAMSPEKFSMLVDEAFEEFQKNMTSEEAQMHLLKILLLSNELAKEIRAFSHAGIYNGKKIGYEYSEWQKAMEKLTTEKTAQYINYILESNSEKIEPQIMDSLMINFYNGMHNDQKPEPMCLEKIEEALRLY
ncbi:MAG: hypothetical protein NC302_10200 [Bacteroidales bacterium]|nr:hypothetical protein [Bacteroidales bacterium]MCM1416447.1 hypothetical protein [bacterium]MCM1424422.1 hypothetical protein [bacterium]